MGAFRTKRVHEAQCVCGKWFPTDWEARLPNHPNPANTLERCPGALKHWVTVPSAPK